MSDRARRLWRILAIIVIAGLPIVASLYNFVTPFVHYGRFGFLANADGTITYVFPKTTAADAGLKPGDRVDVLALSPKERVYVHWPMTLAGRRATFLLSKGPARAVTLVAYGREKYGSPSQNAIFYVMFPLLALSSIAIVLIATMLVLAQPTRTTWAFLFYAAGSQDGSPLLTALLPPPWVVAYSAYVGALWVGSSAALVIFALRFPTDRVRGASAIADRWLPWLPVAIAPFVAGANFLLVYRGNDTDSFEQVLTVIVTALYCLAIVIFVVRYLAEGSAERPRMSWVLASFLVGYSGIIATRISESVGLSVPANLYNLLLLLNVVVPIAVAYALVKQHIVSVRFFVNKAVIFTLLVGAAIGSIALLNWFIGRSPAKLSSSASIAVVVAADVIAAVLLGILMTRFYPTIRDLVDRSFFRRQYRARQRLLSLAKDLAYADSAKTIDEVMVRSIPGDLEIGSVAVFASYEDGAFRQEAAQGWGEDHALAGLDAARLATAFEAARGALRFTNVRMIGPYVPVGDAAPVIGFPIFMRDRLTRFVLFSGHPHGLDLDPSETRLLGEVTRAASRGFARLAQL